VLGFGVGGVHYRGHFRDNVRVVVRHVCRLADVSREIVEFERAFGIALYIEPDSFPFAFTHGLFAALLVELPAGRNSGTDPELPAFSFSG
jgi:hypothetical protein